MSASTVARAAGRARVYVAFTRPFTLLPPIVGVISGAITALGSAHHPDPTHRLTMPILASVALGSICAGLLNAASNALNQYHDLEIDRRNKPRRPLVSGAIGVSAGRRFAALLYVLAVAPTWLIVPAAPFEAALAGAGAAGWLDVVAARATAPLASHQCFLIFLAGTLGTLVYSSPAWGRTKRFGFWANLTIAVPRGWLLKVAGWSMVGSVLHLEPWYIGAIFFLYLLGATTSKDFSDMDGDAAHGCRTLPIRLGVERAARTIAPFFILPWLLIPAGALLTDPFEGGRVLTGSAPVLLGLGVGLAAWGAWTARLILRDPSSLARSENHPSWTHMYLMMMCAQVGFAAAYF